jgi:hypothetical protein
MPYYCFPNMSIRCPNVKPLIKTHLRMIKRIRHGIHLLKNRFRDVGLPVKRSSKWEGVERAHLAIQPFCMACRSQKHLNVHHIVPFHENPALELDYLNLLTLCMDVKECHLRIGHGGAFSRININAVRDAANALAHPEQFEAICQEAKAHALKN